MNWRHQIELNPEVVVGKPVVKGTRLPVEFVLDMIAAGVSGADMLSNYPRLTHEGILACVAYASDLVRCERVLPVGG